MHRADFSVQLDQRKPACVLCPELLLAHAAGPALALRLSAVLEPWLTRSFWQALDASELLLMHPAGAAGNNVNGQALARWIALREGTDCAGWTMRWVGDRLPESLLLGAADGAIVERYERLAEGLSRRAETVPATWQPFDADGGALDTLALSATLDGAIVLCGHAQADPPRPVRAAERLGLVAQPREAVAADTLFATERQLMREALARAGVAVLAPMLPALAVLHVVVADDDDAGADEALPDPWRDSRLWWYPL